MNAFTNKKKLIDGKIFKKSNDARKGGIKRAKKLGGLALKIIDTHEPSKSKMGIKINGELRNA